MQVSGCTVLCTAMTVPGAMPGRRSSTTCSTSASATTQRHTRSDAAASSAGVAATAAPLPSNGSSVAERRAHNVVSKPAATIRRAIGAPWEPRPM